MIFSNTEFYYTPQKLISDNSLIIIEEEAKHITKVMRHLIDDEIFVTNGNGTVYNTVIKNITKKEVIAEIKESYTQTNKLENLTFCIPVLKNQDRFEFALEKSVELGITNFLIFNAGRSYKRGIKPERWERITLAAMKQSLQSFKPKIKFTDKLADTLLHKAGVFVLEQNSKLTFTDYFNENKNRKELLEKETYFVFGPEGGLTKDEMNIGNIKLQLTKNRLRAETAIISTAAQLSLKSIQ